MAKKRPARPATAKDKEHWKTDPEPHDFPAAESYLGLLLTPSAAADVAKRLRSSAPGATFKAKDLLRASGLPLLAKDNTHVAEDLGKVKAGQKLSPVLLVRGDLGTGRSLTVADGYHRVCASYYLDEDADIPCHIVDPVARPVRRPPAKKAPPALAS